MSIGAAASLVVLVRLVAHGVFLVHTQWMNAMYIFGTLAACAFVCACAIVCRAPRVLLCAPCLLALAFLQAQELDQDALHRHGRTEHVQVQQIQQSSDGGLGGTSTDYIVSVLDGPPMKPILENGFKPWNWAVGGTYTVTVDPQRRADPVPGGRPGPPVILRLLQIPLGLGLAYALWRPADRLLRRRRVGEDRRGELRRRSARLRGGHSRRVPGRRRPLDPQGSMVGPIRLIVRRTGTAQARRGALLRLCGGPVSRQVEVAGKLDACDTF